MKIDNSQLQTFKDCPERYRLKYIEGLHKIEEGIEHQHVNFGKAIHSGLEVHYKGGSLKEVKEAFVKVYPVSLDPEDLAKTPENGVLVLEKYIEHYRNEDSSWKVLATEVTDSFKLTDTVEFLVKIDLVIERQGCVYFMDHKTTGKTFNWMYWDRFEPNSQITGYTAYCQAKYGECSGGIINAIRMGHRQRAYKGEPAGAYSEFQRQIFNRNKGQVEDWRMDISAWTETLKQGFDLPKGMSWLKNEGQCLFCQYKPICISCNDEQIIEQLFEVKDPLEYLGNTEIVAE
jgi:hypothetical protein